MSSSPGSVSHVWVPPDPPVLPPPPAVIAMNEISVSPDLRAPQCLLLKNLRGKFKEVF